MIHSDILALEPEWQYCFALSYHLERSQTALIVPPLEDAGRLPTHVWTALLWQGLIGV